jgi:bifunctional DNA-binding transcriptional regulator/antitoxin component of YhaV-PrlF toxin-antitoxin module
VEIMEKNKQKFTSQIQKHEGINGAYVIIPFDVEEVFGAKRVKVRAFFDGEEYRGSIVKMGDCFMIGMTQALRKKIEKEPGDTVEVEVEKDEEERIIELPDDFKLALDENITAKAYYETLSFSHKKKFYQWITSSKKHETRLNRIEKAIEMLVENKKLK